jgi:hypothetical protein
MSYQPYSIEFRDHVARQAVKSIAVFYRFKGYRIVAGDPIHYYIIAGYVVVVVQTFFAPRMIIPLAYDSGGVTTSTVTVPLVAALGLGLSETVPGRNPLVDGFGLIAFASLFPMITVMTYAQLAEAKSKMASKRVDHGDGRCRPIWTCATVHACSTSSAWPVPP